MTPNGGGRPRPKLTASAAAAAASASVSRNRAAIAEHLMSFGRGFQRARHALLQASAKRDRDLRSMQNKLDRYSRANGILTSELISVKEQLAQCRADKDVLIEELKLCEALGALPSEERHAHGQHLVSLRARAALQKVEAAGVLDRHEKDAANGGKDKDGRRAAAKAGGKTSNGGGGGDGNGSAANGDSGGSGQQGNKAGGGDRGSSSDGTGGGVEGGDKQAGFWGGEGHQVDEADAETTAFFESCIECILVGNETADSEFQRMLGLMKTACGRHAFTRVLDQKRSRQGRCYLSDPSFELMCYLMKECLDEAHKATPTPDYHVARMFLSVGSIYYRYKDADAKEFVEDRVRHHPIWSDVQFWEEGFFEVRRSWWGSQ